ncbi:hypothetical protein [Streptomyces sp. NPDC001250]|uniref:hypothetical protein n=1 Tax=unclassified Streptomyces TaxID=2593676 RepID=UPI003328FFEF
MGATRPPTDVGIDDFIFLPTGHPPTDRGGLTRSDPHGLPVVPWPREAGPVLYEELLANVLPDGPPHNVAEEPDVKQVVASVAEGPDFEQVVASVA